MFKSRVAFYIVRKPISLIIVSYLYKKTLHLSAKYRKSKLSKAKNFGPQELHKNYTMSATAINDTNLVLGSISSKRLIILNADSEYIVQNQYIGIEGCAGYLQNKDWSFLIDLTGKIFYSTLNARAFMQFNMSKTLFNLHYRHGYEGMVYVTV